MKKDLVALLILDGWGIGKDYPGNAITNANTKNYDELVRKYPHTGLIASGTEVGLPEGQMGNSEVGHLNMGAGRVVYQELTRITKSIEDGDFFKKQEFLDAIENCKKNNSALHLMGLLSDGGVHSHSNHLYALLELAKKEGLKDVFVHCFLDGRDTPPQSGTCYLKELNNKLKEIGIGKVATIMGRYFSLDRDKRWDRVEKAYNAIVLGEGDQVLDADECILNAYPNNITDEFVPPTVVVEDNKPIGKIKDNDSVIFFNFRPDRAREITRAIVDRDFHGFMRKQIVKTHFVCMTMYASNIERVHVAFKPQKHKNTLGEYLATCGKKQLRIAETEKYAHVTFFFNGGEETPNINEERVLIPSPKVATYDLEPTMGAVEIKNEVIDRIKSGEYDVIILNFANPDMVGHTGELAPTIKGIETVDKCLGEVVAAILDVGGKALITADHGNAERMIDEKTGGKVTAHTTNKVPCIIVGEDNIELTDGSLANVAPTILDMMNLSAPKEMTGCSLIKRK